MSVFFFVINRRRSLVGSPKYPTRREVLWAHIECTLGSMLYMLFISRTFFSLLVRSFSCVRPSSRDKFSVFMRSSPEKKTKIECWSPTRRFLSLFCVSHFTHSCFYYCHYPIAGNHGNTENLLLFSFISPSILWLGCWLRYNVSLHVSSRVSFSYSLACLCSDIRAESINIVFFLFSCCCGKSICFTMPCRSLIPEQPDWRASKASKSQQQIYWISFHSTASTAAVCL